MIRNFAQMKSVVRGKHITIVVAAAQDDAVLKAVYASWKEGICDVILVGDEQEIRHIAGDCNIPLDSFEILNVSGPESLQCETAVGIILQGRAQVIMKGLVETPILLKEIIKQKEKLMVSDIMNHVALFEIPDYHKLLFISDSGMLISPDIHQKKLVIKNCLKVMQAFEIENPKIATLCAKEKIDPKMPATMDAVELQKLNEDGQITDCILSGPIAMDVAIDKEAAMHKGIKNPVAGDADLLLMPSIEAGNIIYKTLVNFANAKNAGVVVGARIPIVLTSRSDSEMSKIYSIAFAALLMNDK